MAVPKKDRVKGKFRVLDKEGYLNKSGFGERAFHSFLAGKDDIVEMTYVDSQGYGWSGALMAASGEEWDFFEKLTEEEVAQMERKDVVQRIERACSAMLSQAVSKKIAIDMEKCLQDKGWLGRVKERS